MSSRRRPAANVFKPRGVSHTFWNATRKPAPLIELILPAGFERFFAELAAAYEDGHGTPAPMRVGALAERYDCEFLMDWVPELEARFGISVIHQGGH